VQHNGKDEEEEDCSPNAVERVKVLLERALSTSNSFLRHDCVAILDKHSSLQFIDEKLHQVLKVGDLVLSSMMGEEAVALNVPAVLSDDVDDGGLGGNTSIDRFLSTPHRSRRQFALLSIQFECSIDEL